MVLGLNCNTKELSMKQNKQKYCCKCCESVLCVIPFL